MYLDKPKPERERKMEATLETPAVTVTLPRQLLLFWNGDGWEEGEVGGGRGVE